MNLIKAFVRLFNLNLIDYKDFTSMQNATNVKSLWRQVHRYKDLNKV